MDRDNLDDLAMTTLPPEPMEKPNAAERFVSDLVSVIDSFRISPITAYLVSFIFFVYAVVVFVRDTEPGGFPSIYLAFYSMTASLAAFCLGRHISAQKKR